MVARYFGAGTTIDAFQVAISVTSLLGSGIGIAAATAIVPHYTRIATAAGVDHARRFAFQLAAIALILSLLLSALVATFPGFFIISIAPSLPSATLESASNILRLLSLMILGLILTYVLTAFYHAAHHFRIPVAGELISQITVVLSLILFSSAWGIVALVWGMILGVLGAIALQLTGLSKSRFFNFNGPIQRQELLAFALFLLPILLCDFAWHAQLILQNAVASGLPSGTISSLGYASTLRNAVIAVVSTNIARGTYPRISELSSKENLPELGELLSRIVTYLVISFVPISVFCSVNSVQIVQAMFMRGQFTQEAVATTASAFSVFSLGLLPSSIAPILLRVCYANRMMVPSLVAMIVGILTFLGLSTTMMSSQGIVGIALSTTVAIIPTTLLLGLASRKSLLGMDWRSPLRVFLLAVGISTFCVLPSKIWPPQSTSMLVLMGVLFSIVYLAFSSLFLRKEVQHLFELIRGQISTTNRHR